MPQKKRHLTITIMTKKKEIISAEWSEYHRFQPTKRRRKKYAMF